MWYICAFGRLIVMFVMFSRLPFYLFEFRTGVNLFYMLHSLFTVSSDISIKSRSVVSMMMLWSNGYQGKKISIVSNIKFITLILLIIQVKFPAVTICNQNRVSCKNLKVSKSYIGSLYPLFLRRIWRQTTAAANSHQTTMCKQSATKWQILPREAATSQALPPLKDQSGARGR